MMKLMNYWRLKMRVTFLACRHCLGLYPPQQNQILNFCSLQCFDDEISGVDNDNLVGLGEYQTTLEEITDMRKSYD